MSDEQLRNAHLAAITNLCEDEGVDAEVLEEVERLKLGRRKRSNKTKVTQARRRSQGMCVASHAGMVQLAHDPLPQLPPELPEVAFVGRSNAGKSALLNALTGLSPQTAYRFKVEAATAAGSRIACACSCTTASSCVRQKGWS